MNRLYTSRECMNCAAGQKKENVKNDIAPQRFRAALQKTV